MSKLTNSMVLFFALFTTASCNAEIKTTLKDLDQFCGIVSSVHARDISMDEKVGSIVDQVHEQLPVFYEEYYLQVVTVPAIERYEFYKKVSKFIDDSSDWQCSAMAEYYQWLNNESIKNSPE